MFRVKSKPHGHGHHGLHNEHLLLQQHPFLAMGQAMASNGQQQQFVQMAFDYDYVAEDGKKVLMREGEVLLLLNKTNHDWWQVRKHMTKKL